MKNEEFLLYLFFNNVGILYHLKTRTVFRIFTHVLMLCYKNVKNKFFMIFPYIRIGLVITLSIAS